MPDVHGKPWALVSETKVGDVLITDDGFDCMKEGVTKKVRVAADGTLYVCCNKGKHGLDGQLSNDGTEYVGL